MVDDRQGYGYNFESRNPMDDSGYLWWKLAQQLQKIFDLRWMDIQT